MFRKNKLFRKKWLIISLIASTGLVLALGAVFYYRFQVMADYSNPGYATAIAHLEINVSSAKAVYAEASFIPTSGGKNKYIAQRNFSLPSAGLHTIEWNIQKLPPGKYKVIFSTSNDFFQPGRYVTLSANLKNDAGKFIYFDDGTTVAKYLEQKSNGQFAGNLGQSNSVGNGSNNSGNTTSPLAKDCGNNKYSGELSLNSFISGCFNDSFIKCESAKMSLESEDSSFQTVFEILGWEGSMCKVKGWVANSTQESQYYKTGQTLDCKLDSEEGFYLSFLDALTDYHKKYNYAINRAEVCSGDLFEAFKKTYSENNDTNNSSTSF